VFIYSSESDLDRNMF